MILGGDFGKLAKAARRADYRGRFPPQNCSRRDQDVPPQTTSTNDVFGSSRAFFGDRDAIRHTGAI